MVPQCSLYTKADIGERMSRQLQRRGQWWPIGKFTQIILGPPVFLLLGRYTYAIISPRHHFVDISADAS